MVLQRHAIYNEKCLSVDSARNTQVEFQLYFFYVQSKRYIRLTVADSANVNQIYTFIKKFSNKGIDTGYKEPDHFRVMIDNHVNSTISFCCVMCDTS